MDSDQFPQAGPISTQLSPTGPDLNPPHEVRAEVDRFTLDSALHQVFHQGLPCQKGAVAFGSRVGPCWMW